jgi:adenosine deaminase
VDDFPRFSAEEVTMNPADFIRQLPKAELHLHLEGAIPWDMLREVGDDSLPLSPEWWAADFRYRDFDHFSQVIGSGMRSVLTSVDHYHRVAQHIFPILAAQNVRYAEISFSAEWVCHLRLPLNEVAEAVKAAAPEDLQVAIFCGFKRTIPPQEAVVDAVFSAPAISGIDLHDKEVPGTAQPYAAVYQAAQARGLMTKAHAGELLGAESIWEAIHHLNVKRIEHGTRAIEDDALVNYLVEHDITLDLCPTSNLKLRVVDSLAAHPIKALYQRGVRVTINTDDPTFFGCSLTDELTQLAKELDFTTAELAEIQKNAFRVAKITDSERQAIIAEIDALQRQSSSAARRS